MSAPLYVSETRSIPISDLPSALRNSLLMHADRKKLKLVAASAWLTHRENVPSATMLGKLLRRRTNHADPDASHDMVLVVHATHLLVATSGARRGTSVLSLPLLAAILTRASGADADLPNDDGLTIRGFASDQGDAGSYFMGLGAGAAANDCIRAAMAAVDAAKNPAA